MIELKSTSSIIPSIIYKTTIGKKSFIDRGNYLNQIKKELSTSGRVALIGPAHIGKTLTAIHYYMDKNKDGYWYDYEVSPIYFNATTEDEFLKTYKEFAWLENITPINPEINQDLINKINEYVMNHAFLFIFDNVIEEESWIEKYLPESHKTHVIITSRNPISINHIPTIEMKPFTREDSLAYIKKNLSQKCYGGSYQNAFSRADELANRLQDSPVNLEKAINYMNSCVVPIPKYLDSLFKSEFPNF